MPGDRILITGVCGFTGRHLVAHLCRISSAAIVGIDTREDPNLPIDGYHRCDLTNRDDMDRAVTNARPTVVFHLASLIGSAEPAELARVNVGGFQCLSDTLRRHAAKTGTTIRVVTIGSAAEIGTAGAAKLPVSEEARCEPETAYGRSKLEVTRLAMLEPASSPLKFLIARSFNLLGPGLSSTLSLGSFVQQVAAAVRGETESVRCGSLETSRDFVDVRDAASAYCSLAQVGRPGQIYNVCRGRSYRLGRLLDMLLTLAYVKVRIVSDSRTPRQGDVKDIYGDCSKIVRETGWKPAISIEHSLMDMLAAA